MADTGFGAGLKLFPFSPFIPCFIQVKCADFRFYLYFSFHHTSCMCCLGVIGMFTTISNGRRSMCTHKDPSGKVKVWGIMYRLDVIVVITGGVRTLKYIWNACNKGIFQTHQFLKSIMFNRHLYDGQSICNSTDTYRNCNT